MSIVKWLLGVAVGAAICWVVCRLVKDDKARIAILLGISFLGFVAMCIFS